MVKFIMVLDPTLNLLVNQQNLITKSENKYELRDQTESIQLEKLDHQNCIILKD